MKLMDTCGINWSYISLSSPQPYFPGDDQEAIEMCRSLNERAAALKETYPDRFGFGACLPLPNVSAAVKEAEYALDQLHANGVKLASNSRGLYLGDPALEPLMEVLNDRKAICNIHPHRPEPIKEGIFSSGPVPLYEFLADTTRAVLNLISHGVIEKYPEIKWIVPHCGSFLPNIYDRFLGISEILVPQGLMERVDVQENFGRLYFDLSGTPVPHMLDLLLTVAKPDHIMYGADFPFTPAPMVERNLRELTQMLSEREDLRAYKDMILHVDRSPAADGSDYGEKYRELCLRRGVIAERQTARL